MFVFVTRFKFAFIPLFCAVLSLTTFAQVSDIISTVKVAEAKESEEVIINAELMQSVNLERVTLFYKTFNSTDYKEVEMSVSGRVLQAIIPAEDVQPPYLEYYINVNIANQTAAVSYPANAPEQNTPARLNVLPKSPKDKELIFLSPEKNKTVPQSEFFISISLLRSSASVNKAATKMFIDGIDITGSVLFAEDMLLFNADNFSQKFLQGRHELKVVLYDFTGTEYYSATNVFLIISDEEAESELQKFTYSGTANAESRNENTSGINTWYNNLSVNMEGNYKDWDMFLETYVSSEEKKYLQPVNRYKMEIKSSWLEFSAGDHSPKYPSVILSGRRVRGISGAVNLGFFNLQTTFGEISRGIEGEYTRLFNPLPGAPSESNYVDIDSAKYGFSKAELSKFGTYKRDIVLIRPSFGKGEKFQFGLTYLHSKDNTSSINFSSKPQENLVVGTDLYVGVWEQKISFTGQAAVSVQNTDISSGTFTDDELDSLLTSYNYSRADIDNWKKYKNQASKLITINQYLEPFNPQELPTLAAEAAVTVNLSQYGNYFKSSYIYRGGDYNSFGNSFLRTNVKGINILDRQRFFENQFFVSLGFEQLTDNLQKTYRATTTFQTLSTSVSYYPRFDFPSLMVSFTNNNNTNDLVDLDSSKVNVNINRITVQSSYDFVYVKRHQVSIGFSTSNKDDQNIANNYDSKNSNVNFGSSTNWTDVLTTNFNVIVNRSTINTSLKTQETLNYVSLNLGGRYFLLNNDLNLFGALSPSFGDFKRFGIETRAQYKILKNFYIEAQLRYYLNSQIASVSNLKNNDYVFGFSTQYNW